MTHIRNRRLAAILFLLPLLHSCGSSPYDSKDNFSREEINTKIIDYSNKGEGVLLVEINHIKPYKDEKSVLPKADWNTGFLTISDSKFTKIRFDPESNIGVARLPAGKYEVMEITSGSNSLIYSSKLHINFVVISGKVMNLGRININEYKDKRYNLDKITFNRENNLDNAMNFIKSNYPTLADTLKTSDYLFADGQYFNKWLKSLP